MPVDGSELVRPFTPELTPATHSDKATREVHWTISPGLEHVIRGPRCPDWFNLAREPRATLIKRNPLREVYRVAAVEGIFYAKCFRPRGPIAGLKRVLLGAPAYREYLASREIAQRGVGAIRGLASGYSPSSKASVFVSEEFAQAVSLADWWSETSDGARFLVRSLAQSLAEFLAHAHQHGVRPTDLHPANLLVRGGRPSSVYELAFADLAGIRVGDEVNEREAAHNLAELVQWFRPRTTASERLRFVRVYVRARWGDTTRFKDFVARVERLANILRRTLWMERDRRITGDNTYFAPIVVRAGWRANATLRVRNGALPAALHEQSLSRQQKLESLQAWVGRESESETRGYDGPRVEQARVGGWRRIWWRLGGSPARRTFITAQQLRHRDLPATSVPAALERIAGTLLVEYALLHNAPAGLMPLENAWRTYRGSRGQSSALLRSAAELVADMADRGVWVREFGPGHLSVISPRIEAEKPLVCITSFQGLRVGRALATPVAAWMLAELARSAPRDVTFTDRLRFLRAFQRRAPGTLRSMEWKRLWTRIQHLAAP